MSQRLQYLFSQVLLLINLIALIIVLVMLLYPYKILVIDKPPKVLTPRLKVGDTLEVEICYCKYMDLEASSIKTLVDGTIYTLHSNETNLPVGCNVWVSKTLIPKIQTGTYFLKQDFIYKPNPLRTVKVTFTTGTFEIYE